MPFSLIQHFKNREIIQNNSKLNIEQITFTFKCKR